MTEGKKTYYQVSFTGGQALAAVVVLIAALGLSFFLGAKAGFEKSGEPEAAARPAVPAGAAPAPAAAAGSETGAASPADAGTTTEEAPVFEDREAGVTEPAKPASAAAEPSSTAPSRTEIATAAPPGGGPAPAPKASGAPAPKSAAPAPSGAAKESARAAAPRKAAASGYWVQIVSTSSKSEANRWREKLAAKKYRTAAVTSVESAKGTLWRVRIGPYADHAQAKKAAAKVTAEFKQKAWVASE